MSLLTKTPMPRRVYNRPMTTRSRYAFDTVFVLTFRRSESSRTAGSWSPGFNRPSASISRNDVVI